LDSSERIHFSRPSIDVTFESVAEVFKTAVTGVLLSGANTDGGLGLVTIKKMGGTSIVQDPATADVGYMPQQAIMLMQPDAVLPAAEIPVTIRNICLGQSEM
jgi:two-component system chemotaxis response regulator CheB